MEYNPLEFGSGELAWAVVAAVVLVAAVVYAAIFVKGLLSGKRDQRGRVHSDVVGMGFLAAGCLLVSVALYFATATANQGRLEREAEEAAAEEAHEELLNKNHVEVFQALAQIGSFEIIELTDPARVGEFPNGVRVESVDYHGCVYEFQLARNSRGEVVVVLDSRDGVSYLDQAAVHEVEREDGSMYLPDCPGDPLEAEPLK